MNRTKKILMLMLTLIMFASALAFSASAANAPSSPATLTATQNTSAIKLTWSKVSGATGYRIYYKLPGDLSWRTAVSSLTATSKTFSNLPSAQRYTFAVRSYTKTSTGTVWGGYKQIQVATNAYAPRTLNAYQTTSSINLTWAEVKKADGYRIYYKKTGTQKWKIAVSNTYNTSHEFTGLSSGIKYDFAVRPYIRNVKNTKSVFWGNYKTISTATEPAPPATVNVQKNEQAKTVTISWSKVKGADCYRVYYRPVYYNIFPIGDFKTAVDATTSTKCTLKWDGGSYEIAIMPMIKTASGTICGSKAYGGINYNSSSGNDIIYTTRVPITAPTIITAPIVTTTWTTSPATTTVANQTAQTTTQPTTTTKPTGIHISINDAGLDAQGNVFVSINSSGWDGKLKSNSQRVPVYVDGVKLESGAMLQISSSTDSNGCQYITLNLGGYEFDMSNSTISFTIPEGFLENKTGTKYNFAYDVTI